MYCQAVRTYRSLSIPESLVTVEGFKGCQGLSGAVKGCRKLSEADVSQKLFHGVLTQDPKNFMMLLDSF